MQKSYKGSLVGTIPTNGERLKWEAKRKKLRPRREIVTPEKRIEQVIANSQPCNGAWITVGLEVLVFICELPENIFQPAQYFDSQVDFDIYLYNWNYLKASTEEFVECDRNFVLTTAIAAQKILRICRSKGWFVG